MNNLMMKMMGIDSVKAIEGKLTLMVNGKEHKVELSEGKNLRVEGPEAKKVKKVLELVGIKTNLKAKEENLRVYEII